MEMTVTDIAASIHTKNGWKVESVVKLNKSTLRITFYELKHVATALRHGMKIAHLSVPSFVLQQYVHIDVP